jgi:acrylyl-CoA reductase (NADPH)
MSKLKNFRAFKIFRNNDKIESRLDLVELSDLSEGEVVIRISFSSVNYKDALAATGTGKILKHFPLIGGIDLAGTVVSSQTSRFCEGDSVLATGFGLGESHDGGYAEYARVPADWIIPLPSGLSMCEAMTLGTAGLTAALSVAEMERNGLVPENGPVVVTGATGGVGSLAIQCLVALGYQVTAFTRKPDASNFLRSLGATDVLIANDIELGTRPLEKSIWAGAVDPVGGEILAWLTRTTKRGGSIASTGLTGGTKLHTTVMPFILRGVKLLGIDSGMCPLVTRQKTWHRLSTQMKPAHLEKIAKYIRLDNLPGAFDTLLSGKAFGRYVVKIL